MRTAHTSYATGRHGIGTTGHLARYSTLTATLAAVLVVLLLIVRLVTVPAALVAVVAERLAVRLDRWLGSLPLPPHPTYATSARPQPSPFYSLPTPS